MGFCLFVPNSSESTEWERNKSVEICKAQVKSVFRIGGGVVF